MKFYQEGIERVKRVHKKNSISSSYIRGVSRREDTYKVVEHYVGSARCPCAEVARRALTYFQGEKEIELLNTLKEDLCKECTRPTLGRSVER